MNKHKRETEEARKSRLILFISWARIIAEITMVIGFFILLFVLVSRL